VKVNYKRFSGGKVLRQKTRFFSDFYSFFLSNLKIINESFFLVHITRDFLHSGFWLRGCCGLSSPRGGLFVNSASVEGSFQVLRLTHFLARFLEQNIMQQVSILVVIWYQGRIGVTWIK
jgi:hypothetical protein